jgi:hypothetical protein
VRARRRLVLGVVLLFAAVIVAVLGGPLSGTTVVAVLLAFVALDVLAPVLDPPVSQRVLLEAVPSAGGVSVDQGDVAGPEVVHFGRKVSVRSSQADVVQGETLHQLTNDIAWEMTQGRPGAAQIARALIERGWQRSWSWPL